MCAKNAWMLKQFCYARQRKRLNHSLLDTECRYGLFMTPNQAPTLEDTTPLR
jgi:hypothetical protein